MMNDEGRRTVMLVTSRETHRWIIPKGWAEKGLEPYAVAEKEAYEEAGLRGTITRKPIGTYRYVKQFRGKRKVKTVPCEVAVFMLTVEQQLESWPEKRQRERRWFTPAEAALLVEEGGLVTLLLELAALEIEAGTAETMPRPSVSESSPSAGP